MAHCHVTFSQCIRANSNRRLKSWAIGSAKTAIKIKKRESLPAGSVVASGNAFVEVIPITRVDFVYTNPLTAKS